ncbi:MAG: DUF4329 domain-containing protein [Jhaorihella sp.]
MIVAFTLIGLAVFAAVPAPYSPPDPAEVAAIKERIAPLQLLSFATQLEYCGYLGQLPDGTLGFSEIQRGSHHGCTPVRVPPQLRLVASLHTHGSYSARAPAEFPTVLDMDSDRKEGVNGYISTPGGRLWYIDSRARVAVQLCGPGCLPQDAHFHAGDDGAIAERYSYGELLRLESAGR